MNYKFYSKRRGLNYSSQTNTQLIRCYESSPFEDTQNIISKYSLQDKSGNCILNELKKLNEFKNNKEITEKITELLKLSKIYYDWYLYPDGTDIGITYNLL